MCRFSISAMFLCLGLVAIWPGAGIAQQPKRSVAELIADLKRGEKEQLQAIAQLDALGEKAAEAAPALVAVLQSKSEDVRLQATMALGKIGKAAVGPLSKALEAKDADVRFYAAWGLAFVGPPAKAAAPLLVKALTDPAAHVRRKAAYALGRIDPDPATVAGPLVAALADADEDVRQAAAATLPGMGKAAVPALLKAAQTDKATLRNVAIKTLGEIGPAAAEAIPVLKGYLLAPDKGAGEAAADALAGIGDAALETLTAATADDSAAVRGLAMRALQKMGVSAIHSLTDLLAAKHVDVRRQAVATLGALPTNEKVVVIGLGYATKDTDFQVRKTALQALRNRGPGAKLAEPYISALLTDIDPQIRLDAFNTLKDLGVDAKPGLKKALSHKDPAVRVMTASLMAQLNLEMELAEPILLEALKEKDETLKMQAANALSLRGLQADVVLPIFLAGLKNPTASVRRTAAEAIQRYGPKAKQAGPALIAALDDPDDSVRAQALTAVRHIDPEPKTLLAAMVKVLKRKDDPLHKEAAQVVFQVGPDALGDILTLLKTEDAPALRLTCLQVLAMVGPPAKVAADELVKALTAPDARARMAAARALGNIGPDAKTALEPLAKLAKDADANVQKIAEAAVAQIKADPNAKGFQVQGVLTTSDPFDKRRSTSHHVVHVISMKAGQTYTIDLISTGWDNYLRLENAQGEELAQDDDSGGNLNARIIFRAPADGWYRIIVTSYAANTAGAYTLKVK
jgi:HEAT repeat protein